MSSKWFVTQRLQRDADGKGDPVHLSRLLMITPGVSDSLVEIPYTLEPQ
jgi:hypothetical protein